MHRSIYIYIYIYICKSISFFPSFRDPEVPFPKHKVIQRTNSFEDKISEGQSTCPAPEVSPTKGQTLLSLCLVSVNYTANFQSRLKELKTKSFRKSFQHTHTNTHTGKELTIYSVVDY